MPVAAQRDAGIGPVATDAADQAPDMARRLGPRRRLAGAQQHRHGAARRGIVDMDRQEAALAIMAVPEGELLATVDDIDRLVDIERHRDRRGGIARTVEVDERACQPHQFARRRRILPSAHRRLARQADRAARQLAERQLEPGIVMQTVEIIGILIAAGDRQHASTQDVAEVVDDAALVARVGNAGGKPFCKTKLSLHLRQQQHATVRGQPAAVKGGGHFLAANRWE
jgi:GAF domain-containing protein